MKRLLLITAIAAPLALGGCWYTNAVNSLNTDVTATNNVLANLAANDIPTACGIIAVAEGYFAQLEPRISAANIAIEHKAAAAVDAICSKPPANVAQAFGSLLNAWIAIQNATKA